LISQGKIGNGFGPFCGVLFSQFVFTIVNGCIGHELLHRRQTRDKICGTLVYARFFYGHYFIQHVSSHHKMVATVHDASTGRLGESYFAYFPRAIK